jgi:hypothetical protein
LFFRNSAPFYNLLKYTNKGKKKPPKTATTDLTENTEFLFEIPSFCPCRLCRLWLILDDGGDSHFFTNFSITGNVKVTPNFRLPLAPVLH